MSDEEFISAFSGRTQCRFQYGCRPEDLVGGTRIQGERLEIMVNAVEYKGTILPVELEVYDLGRTAGNSGAGFTGI